jgi:formate-dependent nitrite reductase membrane component NrfD
MVHGELWTLRDLFILPNEYVYWSIQIVMYPFLTGLVAGAFVLSSLYHVFGIARLKDIARFALVLSFALLPGALAPLLLHLQHPLRGINVMMTPHFTSAIAAFGVVFSAYFAIVASEVWFVYRRHFISRSADLRHRPHRRIRDRFVGRVYAVLTLGSHDLSEAALRTDEKATRILAAVGIPVALFLHGYAGFIFGSVKANALWMTPLMPVIFIVSAVVSGVAFCLLVYIVTMELAKLLSRRKRARERGSAPATRGVEVEVVRITARYLLIFLVLAVSLELLDAVFRRYTAVKSWDVVRSAVYGNEFRQVFVLQYGIGALIPLILLVIPRVSIPRAVAAAGLVLFGVFMMRWNVVIGGQSFSLTLAGYMHYLLPIVPHSWETLKEGLVGAVAVMTFPLLLFYVYSRVCPVLTPIDSGGLDAEP